MTADFQPVEEKEDNGFHTTGIWIQASYINHSCVPNARRSFIGDMQFVRTTCDIPMGTEIVFPYVVASSYNKRQQKLKNWGFTCTCALCLDEKNTTKQIVKKRADLFGDLRVAIEHPDGVQVDKAERLIAIVRKTYKAPPTEVPCLKLYDACLFLGRLHAFNHHPAKTVELVIAALTALGYVIEGPLHHQAASAAVFKVKAWGRLIEHVVEAFIHLTCAYKSLAPSSEAAARDYARLAYSMVNGEDTTFEEFSAPFLL